jgi:hypothetical protein
MRKALTALAAAAVLGTGITLAAPAMASTPAVGVGTALETTNPAYYNRPDVYIGMADEGTVSTPLAPGSVTSYTMLVENTGSASETISLVATASEWGLSSGTQPQDDASDWTSFSVPSVTLDPGASTDVTVTVTVPADATPGEVTDGGAWAYASGSGGQLNDTVASGVREEITVASLDRTPLSSLR